MWEEIRDAFLAIFCWSPFGFDNSVQSPWHRFCDFMPSWYLLPSVNCVHVLPSSCIYDRRVKKNPRIQADIFYSLEPLWAWSILASSPQNISMPSRIKNNKIWTPYIWFVHWPHLLPTETYESLSNFPVGGSDPFVKLNPEGDVFSGHGLYFLHSPFIFCIFLLFIKCVFMFLGFINIYPWPPSNLTNRFTH